MWLFLGELDGVGTQNGASQVKGFTFLWVPILLTACWKREMPGEGGKRRGEGSSSWQPRGSSVKMFKIMRHLCTFLQGTENKVQ